MRIDFLLADEIRPEIGGKQTILGYYADANLLIEPIPQSEETLKSKLPEGIDRLAFLITVSDVPGGQHKYKGQIIDPSGNPHGPEMPLGELDVEKDRSRSFAIEAKPFLLKGKGTYHFNFYVDEELHSFPFRITARVQETPAAS